MTSRPEYLLLARYKVNAEDLRAYQVSLLDFVWQGAIQQFVAHINAQRGQTGLELAPEEKPSYRLLNSALFSKSFRLVHGFEITRAVKDAPAYLSPRQILTLETQEPLRPKVGDIKHIVRIWVRYWARTAFQSYFKEEGGEADLLAYLDQLVTEQDTNWYERNAFEFWSDPTDKQRYRVIPSLLAFHMQGTMTEMDGHQIIWRCAQDKQNNTLMAISEPQPFYDEREYQGEKHPVHGTFAYALRFAVHTHAGNLDPWVHLHLSCTRYIDKPVKHLNWKRSITVHFGSAQTSVDGQEISPILVPLSALSYGRLEDIYWQDNLPRLLQNIGMYSFPKPFEILTNPLLYRKGSQFSGRAEFLPVFSEGLRPSHSMKTGFGCKEKALIEQSVLQHLRHLLITEPPLQRDPATLAGRKTGMLSSWKKLIKKPAEACSIAPALSSACCMKPCLFLLCWMHRSTRDLVEKTLRTLFSLQEGENWPAWFSFQEMYIGEELVNPLEAGTLEAQDFYNKGRPEDFFIRWRNQMSLSKQMRRQRWQSTLPVALRENAEDVQLFFFVEVPELSPKTHPSQSPKGVLREICAVDYKARSQFLYPVDLRLIESSNDVSTQEPTKASIGRVENAVADLVLRQTGTLLAPPQTIYVKQVGLTESIAQDLTVIGLYHRIMYLRKGYLALDFIMAVRILPQGRIEMCVPGTDGQRGPWRPYLSAALNDLAPVFLQHKRVILTPAQSLSFIQGIVQEASNQPTLLLVSANSLRNKIWPQLRNDFLRTPYELNMNNVEIDTLPPIPPITGQSHPQLRVVRLREKGTNGETPQYIASVQNTTWEKLQEIKEIRSAFGCVDTQIQGPFFQYLSLGQQPKTVRQQDCSAYKHEKGGIIAYKHQTILEIVPIFLQHEDDPLLWARIPHFLRQSPAWDGGSLLLPYPIHLAEAALEDYLPLLGEEMIQEEEE